MINKQRIMEISATTGSIEKLFRCNLKNTN